MNIQKTTRGAPAPMRPKTPQPLEKQSPQDTFGRTAGGIGGAVIGGLVGGTTLGAAGMIATFAFSSAPHPIATALNATVIGGITGSIGLVGGGYFGFRAGQSLFD